MPIKKSRKTVWIVLAIILLAAFVENGCAQARWASLRIRRGMTVSQALQVSGDWSWGFAYSERSAPEPPVQLPFGRLDISLGGDQHQRFASLDEVAQAVNRQMTGHPWRMSLTYLGAMRYSFAVSFRRTRQGTTRLGHLVYAVVGVISPLHSQPSGKLPWGRLSEAVVGVNACFRQ